MDFFKKLFGGKKGGVEVASSASQGGTFTPTPKHFGVSSRSERGFTCENCGEERSLSQKKEHMASEGGNTKNVCEFC